MLRYLLGQAFFYVFFNKMQTFMQQATWKETYRSCADACCIKRPPKKEDDDTEDPGGSDHTPAARQMSTTVTRFMV